MTSVVDFLVDKRLSKVASWFDVAGALGVLAFVGLWVATRQTDMVLYGLLLWIVLHGFMTTQLITSRRNRRAAAEQVIEDYRELRRSQYPSGSENTHGRSADEQPIDARRRRTPDRAPA